MRVRSATVFSLLSVAVLVWWGLFWDHSVKKWQVRNSPITWYGPYDFMALDFMHNYQATRCWLSGGDPYRQDFKDPIGRKLCYPPVVLVCFAWCKLLPIKKAIAVWTVALAAFAATAAVAAWQARRQLGLAPVPLLVAVAAIVTSSPVAYAMERGNYDLLLVPLVLMMAWGLRRTGRRADAVIGYALALAVCLKVYPGLLVFALLAMRRWRAVGLSAAFGAAFLLFQCDNLPVFYANLQALADSHSDAVHKNMLLQATHSITYSWRPLWSDSKLERLTVIPGSVAALAIVGGLLAWVCWHLRRCPKPGAVLVPVLFWIAAAATFVPKVANDYNVFFLPLAALAVWDRRDPVWVHVALGVMCLWVQPIFFPVSASVIFGSKVAALAAVAACLVNRLREQTDLPPKSVVIAAAITREVPTTTECCHAG